MPKNEDKEIEQKLLKEVSLDELIKQKMEEELAAEMEKARTVPKKQVITEISKVPKEMIFSKKAIYKIFNKVNKTESFLNGLQAEALLGLQNSVRAKIRAGEMDAFSTDNAYVKFEKVVF